MGLIVQQGGDWVGFSRVTTITGPPDPGGGGGLPAPQTFGFNFSTALSQPPGVYVLANGTYTINPSAVYAHGTGSWNQANRVVLVAESQGGVVVNMGTNPVASRTGFLEAGTTNIDLIGISFTGGSFATHNVNNFRMWYCDIQNYDLTYMLTTDGQPVNPTGSNVVHNAQGTPTYFRSKPWGLVISGQQHYYYGIDLHHIATTGYYLDWGARDMWFYGCKGYDLDNRCEDPVDPQLHQVPGPSSPPGGHTNINVISNYSEFAYVLWGSNQQNSSDGLHWTDCDHFGTYPSPFLVSVDFNNGLKMLNITRDNYRYIRIDQGNNANDPYCYNPAHPNGTSNPANFPPLIQITDTNVRFLQWNVGEMAGVHNLTEARIWPGLQANIWRGLHPYSSWPSALGITL